MSTRLILSVLLYLTCLNDFSYSLVKQWMFNIEMEKPSAWENGKVPCKSEKIALPDQLQSVATLPDNLKVNGIIFPINGAILPAPDSSITLFDSNDRDDNCKSSASVAELKPIPRKYYFDPENWEKTGPAVPHVERIPCNSDVIVLSERGITAMDLEYVTVLVNGGFKIGNRVTSRTDLQRFLATETGEILFQSSGGTMLRQGNRRICGCHPPDVAPEYILKVCSHVKSHCEIPKCESPVTPIGHCCPICGATAKIPIRRCNSFDVDKLLNYVNDAAKTENVVDEIITYASLIQENDQPLAQLIIIDAGDYSEKSTEFMKKLNFSSFSTSDAIISNAGYIYNLAQGSSAWVFIFSTFFAVIAFFGLLYMQFISTRPVIPPNISGRLANRFFQAPFIFARFDNLPADGEAASGVMVEVNYPEEEQPVDDVPRSFDNPMFREGDVKLVEVQASTELPDEEATDQQAEKNL